MVLPPLGLEAERLGEPLAAAAVLHAGGVGSRGTALVVHHILQDNTVQASRLLGFGRVRQLGGHDAVHRLARPRAVLRPENHQHVTVRQACKRGQLMLKMTMRSDVPADTHVVA